MFIPWPNMDMKNKYWCISWAGARTEYIYSTTTVFNCSLNEEDCGLLRRGMEG